MAPENAELLYAYGRCLYEVAVARSDVLGGKVGEEAGGGEAGERKKGRGKKKAKKEKKVDGGDGVDAGKGKGKGRMVEGTEAQTQTQVSGGGSKLDTLPEVQGERMFQFTGDENFTMSDDEDGDEGDEGANGGDDDDADEEDEEVEDDFANAYEILDLARILVSRRRDELLASSSSSSIPSSRPSAASSIAPEKDKQANKSSSAATASAAKEAQDNPAMRTLSERLADIYDLQAEISLENERFSDAVADGRAALELKKALHPPQSNLVAEAHYKLSLALEFASVTTTGAEGGDDGEDDASKQQQVDTKMREEAAQEMAAAIESCKLRIKEEKEKEKEKEGSADGREEAKKKQQAMIADVREMVEDMEQRVSDHNLYY